jgi:hypothetical protein
MMAFIVSGSFGNAGIKKEDKGVLGGFAYPTPLCSIIYQGDS